MRKLASVSSFDRVHVGTRASVDQPGGLHGVVKAIAAEQGNLGLKAAVLHSIRRGPDERRVQQTRLLPFQMHDDPKSTTTVIEYHFAQTVGQMQRTQALRSTPSVFHFHGPWWREGIVQGDAVPRVVGKYIMEYLAYHRFTRFTAHSKAFAEVLADDFGVRRSRIAVIPAGVDAVRFTPGNSSDARRQLGLPLDRFIFCSVRRLEPRMGLDLAIDCLRKLPDALLVIGGSGSAERALKQQVRDLGLASRVRFLGRLSDPDVVALYRASDMNLVPSRSLEGFGLVVLESFACGTPTIASDSGGLPEALGPFAGDWTSHAGDRESLVHLMGRAMEWRPSSTSVRQYAESRSWKNATLEIENAFENWGIV